MKEKIDRVSDDIIADWQDTYRQVIRKEPPKIEFFNGWYQVGSFPQKVRASEIVEMTGYLRKTAEARK